MRIGRVFGHAPRRPDSPSPCTTSMRPATPPPHTRTLKRSVGKDHVWPKLTRSLIVSSLLIVPATPIRVRVWTKIQFNKVNVSVLRRDLRRIK
eukprot:1140522-Pelagomonas_calceolata.AAC.1